MLCCDALCCFLQFVFALGWLIFGAQTIYTLKEADAKSIGCNANALYTFAFWYLTISWFASPLIWLTIALLRRFAPPSAGLYHA